MIRAVIKWSDGGCEIIHANTWPEFFDKLRGYDQYIELEAHQIAPHEIRQGRCGK